MLIHRIKHEFVSPLAPDRVIEQIKIRLADGILDAESEFFGSVGENRFKIIKNPRYNMPRFIHGRNSWKPIVIGSVEECNFGSEIKLTLRPIIPVCVLDSFVQAVSLIGVLTAIILCMLGSFEDAAILGLFSLIFLLGIELLVFLFFRLPAWRMIERLKEILSGNQA